MASVIDTVAASTVEDGDTIRYRHPKSGKVLTVDVKGAPTDTGERIGVRGYSHETGDNVTVWFRPDQSVDILGS